MPIFEYNCKDCEQNFEELVYSKDTVVQCPNCGGESVEKQLSTFGVSMAQSSPPCAGGSCGLPQMPPACADGGCCPGCKH